MICWYCHWGMAAPVADILTDLSVRIREVSSDRSLQDLLYYGPSHIVWADENYDDDSIRHCLNRVTKWRESPVLNRGLSDDELDLIEESLVRLLEIPEDVRDCEPDDYDGVNPQNYPPPLDVRMIRMVWD